MIFLDPFITNSIALQFSLQASYNFKESRNMVLKGMHTVPYVGHISYQQTIEKVRIQLFWIEMDKDVVDYISRSMECHRVKVEHRHPTGLLQPLPISENKWEEVTIDFITKLSRKTRKNDSIMVVFDKFSKDAYFVHVKKILQKLILQKFT
jgi:hypothetical protein